MSKSTFKVYKIIEKCWNWKIEIDKILKIKDGKLIL